VNDVNMYGYLEYIMKTMTMSYIVNVRVLIGTSESQRARAARQ